MVTKVSNLGYTPKCPKCESKKGFDVAIDEHTVGANGQYEFVICKSCHVVVGCSLAHAAIQTA